METAYAINQLRVFICWPNCNAQRPRQDITSIVTEVSEYCQLVHLKHDNMSHTLLPKHRNSTLISVSGAMKNPNPS